MVLKICPQNNDTRIPWELEIQNTSPSPKYWISNSGEWPSHTCFFLALLRSEAHSSLRSTGLDQWGLSKLFAFLFVIEVNSDLPCHPPLKPQADAHMQSGLKQSLSGGWKGQAHPLTLPHYAHSIGKNLLSSRPPGNLRALNLRIAKPSAAGELCPPCLPVQTRLYIQVLEWSGHRAPGRVAWRPGGVLGQEGGWGSVVLTV